MDIRLKNIGIIKDSTLSLNGLTVITGKNNSGKTTVGKALYSLLDAVSDLKQKADRDSDRYIEERVDDISAFLYDWRFGDLLAKNKKLFADYPNMASLTFRNRRPLAFSFTMSDSNSVNIHALADELKAFDIRAFNNRKSLIYDRGIFRRGFHLALRDQKMPSSTDDFDELFNTRRDEAVSILKRLLADINKDPELTAYARESINQTLQLEFANQIQPVGSHGVTSSIELSSGDSIFFQCRIAGNKIVDDKKPVFNYAPYKRAYMIDDPFVLDYGSDFPSPFSPQFRKRATPMATFGPETIGHHNFKLWQVLRRSGKPSIFEQTLLDESLKPIKGHIDKIIPGTFEFARDGDYYVHDGARLKISNMATGSKMFAIIKILIEKGLIDNATMLILDEPEIHLHPMWQNSFAEIIALLVQQLDVNVLLTTHSPNFMLALDACMRKYDIIGKTNFYRTEALDDGFVQYKCVTDDMGAIYKDFLQYLSEMKVLRDHYLDNLGE
ncbi:MAG: ATP-binding protein [Clostridiales Family XIII bacterium]|jgi:predicted ATPase|nr:ATP-binding protein [Clostridiales Family XIII bacterium]